ncbi:alpha/beta hydrolase family protein [Curtobacterium sp. MCBD17_035]|uniref:alpha/beta hydrolase n=1 Tax=Curtobacterium sp. MCBD17_035 TaxID=2175673 RepID=UPI000DA9CEEC|nr:alpha/beta hydrolase family protein [Curtobacterium sp. MCBD17_035]WIB67633.1 alpha/beta hydrolase family protein [Curtobacterium sp. MCBD17_035]
MRLHVDERGSGPDTAVLLHGMMGSSESWWRVVPLLTDRGYRVLAIDLPGHGLSERDPHLTVERAAAAVVHAVRATSQRPPALAIGHSFGGLVLAAAAQELRPDRTVYVEAPFSSRGGWDRATVELEYERDRRERTVQGLRASRSYYGDEDCVVEARAAERFDPATAASVAAAAGGTLMPERGSIVVRAEPSDVVDDELVELLTASGVAVRGVPGAAHALWYSHFDGFVGALPEVFGPA